MKKYLVMLSAFIIIAVILSNFYLLGNPPQEERLTIINQEGESIEISVEIADNEEERTVGLSERRSIPQNFGMLFVFNSDVNHPFWMKNTEIPLSIAFVHENGVIIDIQEMKPDSEELYSPEKSYRYALEVNKGFFDNHDIQVGCGIRIEDLIQS